MTSMSKELVRRVDMQEVKNRIVSCFSETFRVDFVDNSICHKNLKT